MADIFVSYSRADRDTVAKVVAALKAECWDVWWDTRLHAGEHWDEVIDREINAARCVVVVWSPISVKSRWVKEEAGFALDCNIVVPLAIENAVPPIGFKLVHTENLSGWTGDPGAAAMCSLIQAVREKLGHTVPVSESAAATEPDARNYFVIRTKRDEKQWIWEEIQQSRLRQGWGLTGMRLPAEHTPENMREWCTGYRQRCNEYWHEELSQEDAESRYRILYPMKEIQAGDRIVIPRMPTENFFCIAIAKGAYEFDDFRRDTEDDDFRHVIPLKTDLRIILHEAKNVDAQIVASKVNSIAFGKAVNRI